MVALQILGIGVVGFGIVLPAIWSVVVVQIQIVGIVVRFHIVHQEGFQIVRQPIPIFIRVRPPISILVLAGEDTIRIHSLVDKAGDVLLEPRVGKAIIVVIVVHHHQAHGIVEVRYSRRAQHYEFRAVVRSHVE